jgi:hypothetical protein
MYLELELKNDSLIKLEIFENGTMEYYKTTTINKKQGKYIKEGFEIENYSDHEKKAKMEWLFYLKETNEINCSLLINSTIYKL